MIVKSLTPALLSIGVLCACAPQSEYFSIITTRMPGGYTATAMQKADDFQACDVALRRYTDPIKANCKDCAVLRGNCERSLPATLKAAWDGTPSGDYSVTAGPMRVLLSGSPDVTRQVCQQMAADITAKGATARCVPPTVK
jgi:hypothetical protein